MYEEHRDCLVVPRESLIRDGEGRDVIVLVQDGRGVYTPVVTGLREGELVEVRAEGLKPGLTVVTEGAYGLPDGARVRVLPPR